MDSSLNLLLGAVVGALLSIALPRAAASTVEVVRSRRVRRREALLSSGKVTRWLLDYYRVHEAHEDLFHCELGESDVPIPLLTRPEWQTPLTLTPADDYVVQASRNADGVFSIRKKLLKQREFLGQRVFFDNNTLYLDRIEDRDGLRLLLRPCPFGQMASRLIELEEETFRAAQSAFGARTPLRDACLRDLETARKVNVRPFSAGCTVALALETSTGYDFLIQTRSSATLTFGGSLAVIPNFGLEPNWTEHSSSRLGVLFFNFLKEYCEELFDYEELIDLSAARRPSVDWFTCLPEAEELARLFESATLQFEFLGFGFDALNGTGNIALLALIRDPALCATISSSIRANWEVATSASGSERIAFIDYRDSLLEQWVHEGRFQYGSAFTIALAVQRLRQIRGIGN